MACVNDGECPNDRASLDRLRNRYLNFVRQVVLGRQVPGYGPQVAYLLKCAGYSLSARETRNPDSLGASPGSTFDLATFTAIGTAAIRGFDGQGQGRSWWDNVLGPSFSMVGDARLKNVEALIRKCLSEGVKGDFFEAGVWRGGASMYAKAVFDAWEVNDRAVWLADSFRGLPAPDTTKGDPTGLDTNWVLSVSRTEVERNFESLGLLDERVHFVEGYFEDTLESCSVRDIAVLRLDGDYYSSTISVLEALYSKVTPGGFVIVDDFGCYESCRNAVYDFLRGTDTNPHILPIDWTGVYWRKSQ